jgi:hypothetical protein
MFYNIHSVFEFSVKAIFSGRFLSLKTAKTNERNKEIFSLIFNCIFLLCSVNRSVEKVQVTLSFWENQSFSANLNQHLFSRFFFIYSWNHFKKQTILFRGRKTLGILFLTSFIEIKFFLVKILRHKKDC